MQQLSVPKSVLIMLICLLALTFSACSKDSDTIITTPIEEISTCYDPQIADGEDMQSIVNNCFEGLVRIDKNGNIEKGVAESWTVSNDGLTYTFNLRKDAVWHVPSGASEVLGDDYKESFDSRVTAHDFVFALKRGLDKNTNAPNAATLSIVEDYYAESDTKLVIKLSSKYDGFLTILTTPICMPCNEEFFEATAGRYGLSTSLILSNGPYFLASFDENDSVVLKQNDTYCGDYKALANKIKFVLKSDDNVGSYDVEKLTVDEVSSLDNTYTTKKYKSAIKTLCFNTNDEQLADLQIRTAFAQATNKENFVVEDETIAEGVVPSSCWLYAGSSYRANSNVVNFVKYDMSEASVTFSEVKRNIAISVTCLQSDEPIMKKVIQDWEKAFGVSLSVTLDLVNSQEELDKKIESGNYQIAYTTIVADNFLAADFLEKFMTGNESNIINLASDEYDELLINSYKMSTSQEYAFALKSCENYLVQNVYLLPTVVADTYIATTEIAASVTVQPSGTVYAFYE